MILKMDLSREEYQRLVAWTATDENRWITHMNRASNGKLHLPASKSDPLVTILSSKACGDKLDRYAATLVFPWHWTVTLDTDEIGSEGVHYEYYLSFWPEGLFAQRLTLERSDAEALGNPGGHTDVLKVPSPINLISAIFAAVLGLKKK